MSPPIPRRIADLPTSAARFVGQPLKRIEDPPLLTPPASPWPPPVTRWPKMPSTSSRWTAAAGRLARCTARRRVPSSPVVDLANREVVQGRVGLGRRARHGDVRPYAEPRGNGVQVEGTLDELASSQAVALTRRSGLQSAGGSGALSSARLPSSSSPTSRSAAVARWVATALRVVPTCTDSVRRGRLFLVVRGLSSPAGGPRPCPERGTGLRASLSGAIGTNWYPSSGRAEGARRRPGRRGAGFVRV